MSREKFLARLASVNEAVGKEVARSHQLVRQAERADKQGEAMAKVDEDVAAFTEQFADALSRAALAIINNTADTSACVDRFEDDRAEVESYVLPKARASVKADMQNVRDTAAAADALLDAVAALLARGQAEAAKPDGEYGCGVEAILRAADKANSKARWNNDHIDTVVYDLQFAANVALSLSDATTDMNAALDYADLCLRRLRRSLHRH